MGGGGKVSRTRATATLFSKSEQGSSHRHLGPFGADKMVPFGGSFLAPFLDLCYSPHGRHFGRFGKNVFFGGGHFSSFLAQNGTLWGVTFGPGLTSSASLATVSAIEKRPQKHKSPEPLGKKKEARCGFYTRINTIFSTHFY